MALHSDTYPSTAFAPTRNLGHIAQLLLTKRTHSYKGVRQRLDFIRSIAYSRMHRRHCKVHTTMEPELQPNNPNRSYDSFFRRVPIASSNREV